MIRENYRDAKCCHNCKHLLILEKPIYDEVCFSYCNLNSDCPSTRSDYKTKRTWESAHDTMEHYVCDNFKQG